MGYASHPSRARAVEVVTDAAAAYPRVLDELVPAAWHHVERRANNRIEAHMVVIDAAGWRVFLDASVGEFVFGSLPAALN